MTNEKFLPYLDISYFYHEHRDEINELNHLVFSSGRLMDGPYTKSCEKELSRMYNFPRAAMVGSCTDALFFALVANNIQAGDEVIITSFSFIGSLTPIIRAGAIPVFVDVCIENGLMNISEILSKITSRTKAIIAVHLYGQVLEMEAINKIAEKHSLIVIEDAAQSIGVVANYGTSKKSECICFSFDPTKVVHAFGSAGAVLCSNESMDLKIKALRYHGKTSTDFAFLGYNSRITEFQAALVLMQLKHIKLIINNRKEIALNYVENLSHLPQIYLSQINNNTNFHKFVIQTEDRDDLQKHLTKHGIQTMIHYNKALYEYSVVKQPSNIFQCQNSENLKLQVLSLPLYMGLSSQEIKEITTTISLYFDSQK